MLSRRLRYRSDHPYPVINRKMFWFRHQGLHPLSIRGIFDRLGQFFLRDRTIGGVFFSGLAAFVSCLMLLSTGAAALESKDILGQWVTSEDKSIVEIYSCGDTCCLKIIWLKEPLEVDGTVKLDKNNPDPENRGVEILGLTIGKGFAFNGKSLWKGGTIYDPENGKSYSCRMELDGDRLSVRGFIGIALLGRTEIWKRKH